MWFWVIWYDMSYMVHDISWFSIQGSWCDILVIHLYIYIDAYSAYVYTCSIMFRRYILYPTWSIHLSENRGYSQQPKPFFQREKCVWNWSKKSLEYLLGTPLIFLEVSPHPKTENKIMVFKIWENFITTEPCSPSPWKSWLGLRDIIPFYGLKYLD